MPLPVPFWRNGARASSTLGAAARHAAVAWGLLGAISVPAAVVQFSQASNPAGLFTASTSYPESATPATTRTAPSVSGIYSFAYWTLNGTRAQDGYGQSRNPASFTILEPTNAVAVYLPTAQDSDADGVPDYFELRCFGSLAQTAASDLDNDGLSLSTEQARGYSPLFADTVSSGGVSRRRGSLKLTYVAPVPGNVTLAITSQPAGFLSASTQVVAAWTPVLLPTAPATLNGYHFTGWLVNGTRVDNAQENQPTTLEIGAATTAVARYTLDTDDTDADGVADWFEYLHYDSLANPAAFDSDGDGYTLATEWARNYSPSRFDSIAEGGISRRRANKTTSLSLGGFVSYRFQSNPAGLVAVEGAVSPGTLVTSPDLWGQATPGYVFACWEIDGIVQVDPVTGSALGQLSLAVSSPLTATARFLPPAADTDGDGVPDWYEFRHYGGLGQTAASDTDGDGLTLAQEQARGLSPRVADAYAEGGVSRRRSSAHTIVNLQFFERLRRALQEGVLAEFFSPDPAVRTGRDFGPDATPALGDWDGDGDLDLFVASSSGLTVWENIGTRFTPDFKDRSAHFAGLNPLVSTSIAVGDWNGDGRADLVLGGGDGILRFIASDGSFTSAGPAAAAFTLDTSSTQASPALGDFTGDGRADLLVLLAGGAVRLYPNLGGAGAFSPAAVVEDYLGEPVSQGVSLGCGDIDGDGRLDVVASDLDGRLWEYHRLASGEGFALTSKVWAGAGNGFAPRLAIGLADLDGDGDLDAVGGTRDGAIVGLRDPRVGRPSGLVLTPGAQSIALAWDPDRQERIKGYNVYRAPAAEGPFTLLNPGPLALPAYTDADVTLGETWFYRVTGLTEAYLPGNSLPRVVESLPSETVSQRAGLISFAVRPAHANSGQMVRVRIAVANPFAVGGTGLQLRLLYDPLFLTPVTQVQPAQATVKATAISRDLVFSDNAATAAGELVVTGSGGVLNPGEGTLFVLNFRVAASASENAGSPLVLGTVTVRDTAGRLLGWECTQNGPFTVTGHFSEGDLDGDGDIDKDDQALLNDLIKLNARPPTADELTAGDLNADGVLDQEDFVLLKRLMKGLPLE